MKDQLKLSVVQPEIIWHQVDKNINNIETLLDRADGADLIVLPEMWSTGFTMKTHLFLDSAEKALAKMKEWSVSTQACVLGTLIVEEHGNCYNRMYVCQNGEVTAQYDKRHLFAYAGEDRHFERGDKKVIIELKGWKIRLNICYDLRFPVWARNYEDYDILVYSANWPDARELAWLSLLRARAIENQAFVIGSNCYGTDAWNNDYKGNSAVFSYDGQSLTEMSPGPAVLSAQFNYNELKAFRERFPFLKDRDPVHFT